MPDWIEEREDCLLLNVVVVPRASRIRVMGIQDGRLKIQLDGPSVDDKANTKLIRFVAEQLGVATAQLDVTGGLTSKHKTLRIVGVSAQRVRVLLEPTSSMLD
jgi:hypothetical protein